MGPIWGVTGGELDILIVLYFAVWFLGARFLLDRLVFKPLAIRLLRAVLINDESRQSKIAKCSESMWKLTYYTSVQLWVISIIKQETWSLDAKRYFKGWPNQELKFFRIGTIILALHDTSDVFLEAAKVFKYSEKEVAASLVFGLFAVSWLLLRLIYFPFWIIKASSYYSIEPLMSAGGFPATLYYVFNMMLLMLLVFHIYWWKLICAMVMRQMSNRGQVGEDIRSDSEDGD